MTVLPELSFQEISQYFHLPISQAAKELKVCETLLKKICRVNGIKRWPHRKIRSIDTMINLLEFRLQSEKLSEKEKNRMRNEISDLIEKKSFFMNSPNTTYQSIIPKNTLQSFSKTKLKNQKSFSQFLNEEAKKPDSTLATHNSLISTMSLTGNGGMHLISNLRSKNRRSRKQKNEEYNSESDDYYDELRIDEDGDDSDYVDNNNNSTSINYVKKSKRNKKENENLKKAKNGNNNDNLEEEEEVVLNVLCSLKENQKNDEVNTSDEFKTTANNNDGSNELYKLSLLAILNPMNTEELKKNNSSCEKESNNNRVKELKKRNVLRRSSDSFDQHSLQNDIKRRKFDYDFANNLEFSSAPSNNNYQFHNNFPPSKVIKL